MSYSAVENRQNDNVHAHKSKTLFIYTFYLRTSEVLMRLYALISGLKCSYFVLIYYETFLPANGKNYFLHFSNCGYYEYRIF